MKRVAVVLFLLFSLISIDVHSTVDVLEANDLTHELFYFEEDSYRGIGWYSVGEPSETNESKYLDKNYTFTEWPHKTESVLLGLIIISGGAFLISGKAKTKRK